MQVSLGVWAATALRVRGRYYASTFRREGPYPYVVNRSLRPRATPFRGLRGARVCATLLFAAARLPAQSPRPAMPDSVRGYIRDAMAAFRAHSVHRTEVEWRALEDSVVAQSVGAQTPLDTWRAFTWALRSVDRHSFLLPPPDKMAAFLGSMRSPTAGPLRPMRRPAIPPPAGASGEGLLDGRIGVAVPAHDGPNRPGYVDSLQARIRALDSAGACGWIVDLREDTGGNMWPMLAGVGPLLGAEVVGSFTNSPPGVGWHYRDGRSWLGDRTQPGEVLGWGSTTPRRVRNPAAQVAAHRTQDGEFGRDHHARLPRAAGRAQLWRLDRGLHLAEHERPPARRRHVARHVGVPAPPARPPVPALALSMAGLPVCFCGSDRVQYLWGGTCHHVTVEIQPLHSN